MSDSKRYSPSKVGRDIIAGCVAGLVARVTTAPFDVLKIRLQLQGQHGQLEADSGGAVRHFFRIVREEGVAALWKGNVAGVALYVSYVGIQFATYYGLKDAGFPTSLSSGCAAMCALTASFPFDTARTVLAASRSDTARTHLWVVLRQPPRVLFRGYTVAATAVVPYSVLQFLLFESLFRRIEESFSSSTLWSDGMHRAFAGGAAGSLARLSTIPLDVVKKRWQVLGLHWRASYQPPGHSISDILLKHAQKMGPMDDRASSAPARNPLLRLSHKVRDTAMHIGGDLLFIWRREGIRGLFRGGAVSVAKNGCVSAVAFTTFGLVQQLLSPNSFTHHV